MSTKSIIALFIILSSSFLLRAQSASVCFKPGEELTYSASYFIKNIWTDLAEIKFSVENVPGKAKPVLKIKTEAATYSSWDTYYKIRHTYQSYISGETFLPLMLIQNSDIKGYQKKNKYIFKQASKIVEITHNEGNLPEKAFTLPITDNSFDAISFIYQVRNIDFSKFKLNQTKAFKLIFMERDLSVKIKYLGTEAITTTKFGSQKCYKIQIMLDKDFIVKKDANFVWLSADNARIPYQIATILPEGEARIRLTEKKGTL